MSDFEDTRPPLDERIPGYEYPDPTPVVARPRLRMPMHEVLRTRHLIQQQMSLIAAEQGQETFQEADDFEIEGEEWISPYEQVFEPVLEDPPPLVDSADEGGKTAAPSAAETPDLAKPQDGQGQE